VHGMCWLNRGDVVVQKGCDGSEGDVVAVVGQLRDVVAVLGG
jgi:hypothetical protein